MLGSLSIFYHANKIWLSIGSCIEIGHYDQKLGKLLTS